MLINALHSAFEDAKIAFNWIGIHNATGILASTVINKEDGPNATQEQIEAAYDALTQQKSNPENIKTTEESGQKNGIFNVFAEKQKTGLISSYPKKRETNCLVSPLMIFQMYCQQKNLLISNASRQWLKWPWWIWSIISVKQNFHATIGQIFLKP